MTRSTALVEPEWLVAHADDPDLRIVDGSWYLPAQQRDAAADFIAGHIPDAVFFDIDAVSDASTDLPHMLPTPEAFAAAVGRLGIGHDDRVVVYDGAGLFSAARVWWTFRVFGHDAVFVLDGGFPRYQREGHPVHTGPVDPPARPYEAQYRPELVRTLDQMRTEPSQVLDARGRGRFEGTSPEPRPNVRSGHIPRSRNLPFSEIVADGRLRDRAALRAALQAEGIDLDRPVVTTCGSGVTASVLALALYELGRTDVPVYDGSWSEWGGRSDTPVGLGPAATTSSSAPD